MPTRNIVLSEAQESLIQDLVDTGRYRNVGEVIRAGLHLLQGSEAERTGQGPEIIGAVRPPPAAPADGAKAIGK